MSTIVQIGKRQLSAELICQHISTSSLLPQLLREIVIDDILNRWQQENSLQTDDTEFLEFYAQLAQQPAYQGMNQAQLNQIAIRHFALQQFKQEGWGHKLGTYYLQRKTSLDRVVCSLMRHNDGQVAQELYFRLQGEEVSFAKLAFKYSQGAEARDGGKIGPISLASLHPVIAQQAHALQPGEISPLFIHEGSYIFLRLEERFSAPFDDRLSQFLLDELFESWLQAQIATEIGSVSVHQDVIEPEFDRAESSPADITAANDLQLLTASELAASLEDRLELSNEGDLATAQPSNTDLLMSSLDKMLSVGDDEPEPSDTAFILSPLVDNQPDSHSAVPTDRTSTVPAPIPLAPPALAPDTTDGQMLTIERGDTGLLLESLQDVRERAPAPIPLAPTALAPTEGEMFGLERGDTGLLLDSLQDVRDSAPQLTIPAADDREMLVPGTSDTELLDALIAAELSGNRFDREDSAIATPTIDALIEELELTADNSDAEVLLAQAPPPAEVPTSFGELLTESELQSAESDRQKILDLEAIDNGPISSPLQEIVAAQTGEPTEDTPRQSVKRSSVFNLYTIGLIAFVTIGGLSVGSYYLTQPTSPPSTSTSGRLAQ